MTQQWIELTTVVWLGFLGGLLFLVALLSLAVWIAVAEVTAWWRYRRLRRVSKARSRAFIEAERQRRAA